MIGHKPKIGLILKYHRGRYVLPAPAVRLTKPEKEARMPIFKFLLPPGHPEHPSSRFCLSSALVPVYCKNMTIYSILCSPVVSLYEMQFPTQDTSPIYQLYTNLDPRCPANKTPHHVLTVYKIITWLSEG